MIYLDELSKDDLYWLHLRLVALSKQAQNAGTSPHKVARREKLKQSRSLIAIELGLR